MKSPIDYYVKSTYGNDRMYIADQAIAQSVSTLTGDKTISFAHISALEKLGFSFRQILPPGSRNYGSVPIATVERIDVIARDICIPDSRTSNL